MNFYRESANLHAGEADQVGTDTEARTLACRHADRGGEDVEHREHRRSGDGNRQDLIEGEGLPGDEHECKSNGHALNDVLDYAAEKIVDIHFIYIRSPDFFCLKWDLNGLNAQ